VLRIAPPDEAGFLKIQKYIPIRVWRRQDPAGAARYKEQSFKLAAQLLPGNKRSLE
jgi:hypothetical protein